MSSLSQPRFNALHGGLNAAAKKVYEAVPIEKAWGITQILSELTRLGHPQSYRLVEACLSTLTDAGLVKCHPTKAYIRVAVRQRQDQTNQPQIQESSATTMHQENEQTKMKPAKTAPEAVNSVQSMGKLADDLRQRARDLVAMADQIDAAALAFDDAMAAERSKSAQFRQLKQLLASMD